MLLYAGEMAINGCIQMRHVRRCGKGKGVWRGMGLGRSRKFEGVGGEVLGEEIALESLEG
jgi:hypothetical protein